MPKMITVIKIGTSVLFSGGEINHVRCCHFAEQIATVQNQGNRVILVVSGAVAEGSKKINLKNGNLLLKSCAAGIGQIRLMTCLHTAFDSQNLQIAQILLTKQTLASQSTKNSLATTLQHYLEHKIVPVINENDVIDLNSFGGNDYLAVEVAITVGADNLLMLSTMAGSKHGVGGGAAKLHAVSIAKNNRINTNIVDGTVRNSIINGLNL